MPGFSFAILASNLFFSSCQRRRQRMEPNRLYRRCLLCSLGNRRGNPSRPTRKRSPLSGRSTSLPKDRSGLISRNTPVTGFYFLKRSPSSALRPWKPCGSPSSRRGFHFSRRSTLTYPWRSTLILAMDPHLCGNCGMATPRFLRLGVVLPDHFRQFLGEVGW